MHKSLNNGKIKAIHDKQIRPNPFLSGENMPSAIWPMELSAACDAKGQLVEKPIGIDVFSHRC